MTAIAIAGMACRYPDADSCEQLWENVLSQRRAFRRLPPERLRADDYLSSDGAPDRTYSLQAAVLEGWEFDRVRFRISGSTFRSTDLAHWLALEVAAEALADAGHPDADGLDRARTLVVVGNTLTGEFSRAGSLRLRWPYVRRVVGAALAREGWTPERRAAFLDELEDEYKAPFAPVDEDTLAGGLSNTIAGRICNTFDFKGGGYTVDGACAASLLAVATAAAALEDGDADVALAGGVDLSLDPFELVGFAKAGALAREEMRVYDARPEGFWPGEGCGFVVLRRLEDARANGRAPPVAIRGWGVSSDGAGGITRPELEGQLLALGRAYERAGFGIDTVSLFEGHGTGTSIGDATELAALTRARQAAGATRAAAIGSVKANIGHTKAAAGVAGLIKAALSLREEVVPPTTGCEQPHAELAASEPRSLRVVRAAEPWPASGPLRAAVSAMGFGGIDTHVVLERVAPRSRRGFRPPVARLSDSWQDAELFLFAGSRAEVADAVASVRREAGTLSFAELADLAAALAARLPVGPVDARAAVVAGRPAELEARAAQLAAALESGEPLLDPAAGVAFSAARSRPRTAFLFTGQGSPASRDGGALARRFGFAREVFAEAAPAFADADDLVETAVAQPAIVTASLAGLELLRRLGIEADVALGHSLGEITALHWGGGLDAADAVALAAARGRAMSELGTRGGAMASVPADAARVEELVAGTGAVVAGLNGARRTVVSGSADAVATVAARAERAGLAVTPLRVSHAFHSPLVAAAAEPLRAFLSRLPLRSLSRRVVSTVTGTDVAPDEDLVELLTRQVTSPVRFAEALGRAAAGADVLVEVGPGQVLATLARDEVRLPVLALDAGGSSLREPLFVAGALFALGAPVRHEALFAGRFTRPFQLGRPRAFLASPCESAPVVEDGAAPRSAEARPEEALEARADALATVRALVARRAELPEDAVVDDARLLGDLHLSSIAVAEVAAAAARALGVAAPAAPGMFATATVAQLAEALEQLAGTDTPEPAAADGVGPWVRAYESVLVERARPRDERAPTSWTVVGAEGHPLTEAAQRTFAGGAGPPGVVLVVAADARDRVPALALEAARADAERVALVEDSEVAAAFARVLHLERSVPTCVIRIDGNESLGTARAEAETTTGFREVVLDTRTRRVPVWSPVDLAPADWPLERGDVLLVTGGGKGIAAECALALARRRGLALALVGRADPATDAELPANLERLAGIRHAYVRADVCDRGAVAAAVAQAEETLGPIAAILHAAGVNRPALLADLDEDALRETLRPKVDGLSNVLAAVEPNALKLVVTFGSIIARAGLAGEAHYALA
ncbi:MAG TPA: type I polyketide synthase, partial [Gaiellaceae bacterium]